MAGFTVRERARLEAALPWVPPRLWDRVSVSQAHVDASIGIMGLVILAAAADGARMGGRSTLYQTVLAGFGWHAVGHVAQSVATRGYTPGVVTAPLIVAPFSFWAWRRLRAAGVAQPGGASSGRALLLFPLVLGGVHALAALTARRSHRRNLR